jgi:filamentous hemagglutinin
LGSVLAGVNASDIYAWRAEAGNTLMSTGFDNFRDLYNYGTANPIAWDIFQLHNEQQNLQPVHETYLQDRNVFTTVSEWFTDTNIPVLGPGNNPLTNDKQGQPGGVNILDYKSRVEYGCRLLGYSAAQGCSP